jgi:hypothetical protein
VNNESQILEEKLESSEGGFDWILFIALVALIVFVAVAAVIIIFDTRGLYYPGREPSLGRLYPLLGKLT